MLSMVMCHPIELVFFKQKSLDMGRIFVFESLESFLIFESLEKASKLAIFRGIKSLIWVGILNLCRTQRQQTVGVPPGRLATA